MPDTAADTYLRDVHARAETLPLAPAWNSPHAGEAIAKRAEERHTCDRCGALAMAAYITHTEPPRWLDLCAADTRWVLDGATPAWRTDA